MKTLIAGLALSIAFMGMGSALAEESAPATSQKDECLLISKKCQTATLSLQEKIQKLHDEINKGEKVYSPEELKKLEQKLKDTQDFLDNISAHPTKSF